MVLMEGRAYQCDDVTIDRVGMDIVKLMMFLMFLYFHYFLDRPLSMTTTTTTAVAAFHEVV
jgi:hypothetical protein